MRPEARREVAEEVEAGLSPGKLKIIRLLLRNPSRAFTRYEIGKTTPLRSVDIRSDLEVLVKIGWVQELPYQPTKYRINLEMETVKHLAEFLRKTGYT